jgi:hypothetical protein
MRSGRAHGRSVAAPGRRWPGSGLLTVAGSTVILFVLLAPAALAGSATTLTAPYHNTSFFWSSWASNTGCWNQSVKTPHWNATSGRVGMSVYAGVSSCMTNPGPTGSNSSISEPKIGASVVVPFTVSTSGPHAVFANWSVAGAANISLHAAPCTVLGTYNSGCQLSAEWTYNIYVKVQDLTNGSSFATRFFTSYGKSGALSTNSGCSHGNCTNGTSMARNYYWHASPSLEVSATLDSTHRYAVVGTIVVLIYTTLYYWDATFAGGSANARVAMNSATHYTQLSSVTIT